jgi:hypothetical protein
MSRHAGRHGSTSAKDASFRAPARRGVNRLRPAVVSGFTTKSARRGYRFGRAQRARLFDEAIAMTVEDRPGQGPIRQVMSAWMVLTALAVAMLVISLT